MLWFDEKILEYNFWQEKWQEMESERKIWKLTVWVADEERGWNLMCSYKKCNRRFSSNCFSVKAEAAKIKNLFWTIYLKSIWSGVGRCSKFGLIKHSSLRRLSGFLVLTCSFIIRFASLDSCCASVLLF